MGNDTEFDVVIVGCGLVGAAMALSLRDLNLRVAIADRQAFDPATTAYRRDPSRFDARVSALTVRSQQHLAELGVWEQIDQMRHRPYQDMQVWDGEGTGSIHFRAADIAQQQLGTIVENSVVMTALTGQLDQAADLARLIPFSIDSLQFTGNDSVEITASDGQRCRTKLLIGADGANSRVRELMSFTTREWDYQHTAIVTTVRTECSHENTAWQRFMATGPLAFLPLGSHDNADQQHCSVVWSVIPERAEELMTLSDPAFCVELGRAFEHRLGDIQWADKRFQLPLRQRHATEYYRENVVLVGDAAHTVHPLAGQGVNLGLLDAYVLAAELQHGVEAGRALNDPVLLARYQRRRRAHNLGMMWLMEGFKHLFAAQTPSLQWLRNAGMNAVDNLTVLKNQLARRAMGLE